MRILEGLIQGSPEWKAVRSKYPCASEAPIIMGASRHMTRAEMLRLKSAGMEKEFSDFVQRMVLDKGHQVERPARAITEQQLDEELYPATAVADDDSMLASLDGITMVEDTIFEHKQWNEELAAAIRAGATEFPDGQEWQLEQQLIVANQAERVIFVCSDGTEERRVQMEYRRVPGRAEQLRAGWAQFNHDLEHGDHTPAPPKAVAPPMEALPVVSVRMEGTLRVISNLDVLAPALRAYIDCIPAKPSTDEEFAHAEAACKALKKVEEALDAQEESALASLESFEQMRRLKATLHKLARDTRLQREKLVEARKLEIRREEIERGKQALAEHIAGLNTQIGKPYMPQVDNDFPTAIKGKKTVQSLRDSIDQHLADCKLKANEIAGRITMNLRHLREHASEHKQLFPDVGTIVLKAADDLQALVAARIAEHKAAEERLLEAERQKIRAEEEAKARAAAAREQQEREDAERRQREEQEAAQRRELIEAQERKQREDRDAAASTPAPSPAVIPMPTRAPAQSAARTLTLTSVAQRLGFTLPAAFVTEKLGVAGEKDRSATKFSEHEFDEICTALLHHVDYVRALHRQQQAA
jgi:predicted phage-related endonuclease